MLTGLMWQVTVALQCMGLTREGSVFFFLNSIFFLFFPSLILGNTRHIAHSYPVKLAGLRRLIVKKKKKSRNLFLKCISFIASTVLFMFLLINIYIK